MRLLPTLMLFNYLTIATHTLRKRWGPTLINVTGLTVGIAACLLIGLWVQHELSYDDFHPGADRIYRIGTDVRNGATHSRQVDAPAPLAPTLVTDVAGVETATQFIHTNAATVEVGNRAFPDQQLVRADSLFLNVFDGFEIARGSQDPAPDDAQSVVVTESAARRYVGRVDAVGETVSLCGQTRRITGVLTDIPEASRIQFDIVGRLNIPSWTSPPGPRASGRPAASVPTPVSFRAGARKTFSPPSTTSCGPASRPNSRAPWPLLLLAVGRVVVAPRYEAAGVARCFFGDVRRK